MTANAWGYRLRLAASYPGILPGATLTPSLAFAHDVGGYSYDGTFLKGRKIVRPGVRAEWDKRYSAELAYTNYSGGRYNSLVDRDNVALTFGAAF